MKPYEKYLLKKFFSRIIPPFFLFMGLLGLWAYMLNLIVMHPISEAVSLPALVFILLETLYLLLLPIPELIYIILSCVKKSRKKRQPEALLLKTENRDLMGFYKKDYKIPWTIFYTTAGIFLFLLTQEYQFIFSIFLWTLLQLLEARYFAKDELLEHKMRLRKDVLRLWQEEKNIANKSLHYALIMEDDSGLIPSSFGNGSRIDSSVLLFDHATEVDPFLAEDQKKNLEENWQALYVSSDFFIYAFDSTKYTAEELEQKCTGAFMYSRFSISKPLYILIKGNSATLDELIRKYAWLPEVSLQRIISWDQIKIKDIINDYMDNKFVPWYKKDPNVDADYAEIIGDPAPMINIAAVKEYMLSLKSPLFQITKLYSNKKSDYNYLNCLNYMSSCAYSLNIPLEKITCKDINYIYHYLNPQVKYFIGFFPEEYRNFRFSYADNYFVCGFFSNIFRWKEISVAVMAEFEYANLALRFTHYYLYCKHSPGSIAEYFKEDKELGEGIWELAQPEDMLYASLQQKVDTSNLLVHNALFILKNLFGIEYKEKYLDFLQLTNILRISRNITRGHGAIREGMQDLIWFAVYVFLHLLNVMLSVVSMEIELEEDYVKISYADDKRWYLNEQYAVVQDGMPLLLHGISRKSYYEYINYYKGNAAIPEITEYLRDDIQ